MFLPSFKLGHDIGGASIVSQRVSFMFFMDGIKKQERIIYFKSIGRIRNSYFVGVECEIKDQKILVLFKSASSPAMS